MVRAAAGVSPRYKRLAREMVSVGIVVMVSSAKEEISED